MRCPWATGQVKDQGMVLGPVEVSKLELDDSRKPGSPKNPGMSLRVTRLDRSGGVRRRGSMSLFWGSRMEHVKACPKLPRLHAGRRDGDLQAVNP